METNIRYTFSGHESFYCKSLWLKKGYDFVAADNDFNSPEAAVQLGVGKNMVRAIRYWLRVFGLLDENELTYIAHFLLHEKEGKDPYIEDLGTTWLLHYYLIKTDIASIYRLFFLDFQKEKNEGFTKEQFQAFIKRKTLESGFAYIYNENTVKRDMSVFLQNYLMPKAGKPNEDFSALLLNLNLIRESEDEHKTLYINTKGKSKIESEIFFYSIIDSKQNEQIVSFESLMDLALIFCMSKTELIETLLLLTEKYPHHLRFTDDGGIKQLFFLNELNKGDILTNYYSQK